ncbi:S-type pyocin domain-containing protein [Erwinia sp. MYb416]|uniref:S-type pyocin domain-containing protein n=1 Tax=Erwinia sp. MYb416 TaxID=3108532 RepID=UPI0030B64A27
MTFKGDTSDARIAALNKIIADNARMANSGQAGQRIRNAVKATKQAKAELALINAARKQKAAKQAAEARAKAEAAAKTKAEAEARAKTEAAAKAKVEAEARAKAEAAAKAQREAATNRLRSASVQAVRGVEIGTPASTAPASWAIASAGAITLGEDVAGSLLSRISAVLTELRGIAAASLAGPVAATLAGLLYSEKVGVGSDVVPGRDISALLSTDTLSLPDASALLRAADAGTPIDMAVRGRLIVHDDGTLETQLVRSKVPGKVQVVRAVQDSVTGYWGVTLPKVADVQGPTILVSPVNQPGAGSATLTDPVPVPEQITHFGGPVTVPQGPTVLITPVAEPPGIHDIILVFPPESGLKPQYIIYNSPYGETNAKGKYSGRDYNKDKAGGPIQNLDWKEATIDRAGIDKVKLHAGRFGESASNKVMIERLEKILTGELQVTDTDKRYYTHEIRELERYRNLGVKDNTVPDNAKEVWNNTHTATLEDYKINEKSDPLYTPEALEASRKEEENR